MSIQFNNSDKIYGGFSNATPANIPVDNDLAAGIGLGLLGIGLAAGLAAAMDDDYNYDRRRREAAEAERRQREAEAAERRAREREREAKSRIERMEREERERRARLYGLSESELTHDLVDFELHYAHGKDDNMLVVMVLVKTMLNQGIKFTNSEIREYSHELRYHGVDTDHCSVDVTVSWTGKVEVRVYNGKITKYTTYGEPYAEYQVLVPDRRKYQFEEIIRAMR